jgi:hypothetical protein
LRYISLSDEQIIEIDAKILHTFSFIRLAFTVLYLETKSVVAWQTVVEL